MRPDRRGTARARGRRSWTLPVVLLVVLVLISGCSSRSQARSDLVKSLEDASSDLAKVQLILQQRQQDKIIPTTAEVGIKYAREDVIKAQKKISTLKANDPRSRTDQQRVIDVLAQVVSAVAISESAVMDQTSLAAQARRDVQQSAAAVDRELRRLGASA